MEQAVRLADDELIRREVGPGVGQRVAVAGRRQDAGEHRAEDGEGDRGQRGPGPGPVAAQVTHCEPDRGRSRGGQGRGQRDDQRGEQQDAQDGRHQTADEQQRVKAAVGGGRAPPQGSAVDAELRPAARGGQQGQARGEQGAGGHGEAAGRGGSGRPPGHGRHGRDPGGRAGGPPGGGHGGRHRQRHRDGDQRPRQPQRVDDVPGAGLQPRRVDEPAAQPERGAGQRAGHARGGTAGDHDEPQVAIGGADRGQHAQGAQPPLGHHGEPGHRHQADEDQPEGGQHEHQVRGGQAGRGVADGGLAHQALRAAREVQPGLRALRGRAVPGVEEDSHAAGFRELSRREEGELIPQVGGVLDLAGHAERPAVQRPQAARPQAELAGHPAGHRDLARPAGIAPGHQRQHRAAVAAVRVLRPQVDGSHRAADGDCLVLDHLDRAARVLPPDRGDVGG